jgi:acetolactate synthase regulatory subunit
MPTVGEISPPLTVDPSPYPNVTDAQLERLMDGVSDEHLARALGPRLGILFADRLDDILMPRLQQLAPGLFGTIDLAPLVQRRLDTMHNELESTWNTRIDMVVESKSSILREQAIRLQDQATQSITAVSNDALANFGLASAAAQT